MTLIKDEKIIQTSVEVFLNWGEDEYTYNESVEKCVLAIKKGIELTRKQERQKTLAQVEKIILGNWKEGLEKINEELEKLKNEN